MRSLRPVFYLSAISAALSFGAAAVSCSSSSDDAPATTADAGADTTEDTLTPPRDTAPKTDTLVATDTAPVDPFLGCTRDPGAPSPDAGVDAGDVGAGDSGEGGTDAIPSGGDPIGGARNFTLPMALAGFPDGAGVLTAVITTEKGQIVCTLDEAKAPVSVANFIGLARGTRPAQRSSSAWTYSKFYDGLKWHRVVADFVIQGGDPDGTGGGGPGYDLPTENQIAEPEGTLAMAASDVPSGSQFYIVIGSGPAAKYNVFGKCVTEPVAKLVTQKDHMQKVEIARCPK